MATNPTHSPLANTIAEDIRFIVVDLFCGAGGTTTGFVKAQVHGNSIAKVIACVNHDAKAIKSHWRNHPEVRHFEEDIRSLNLKGLVMLVKHWTKLYPQAKLILWASLECTNYSKAKGGMARDADSRTLAHSLHQQWCPFTKKYITGDSYIQLLQPDFIQIENVVEFMSWGPMRIKAKKSYETYTELSLITDKKTGEVKYGWEPISRKNGQDWLAWRQAICSLGYHDAWKEMNSANYGAYTSRNRLFGCFALHGLPIVWPEATFQKIKKQDIKVQESRIKKQPAKTQSSCFTNDKLPWKPVKEVLDFSDEGESIFTGKPKAEKTLERVYAGLIKFVAGGKKNFLAKIYAVSSSSDGVYDTDSTAHTITTRDAHTLINATFLSKYNGGKPDTRNTSIENPCCTITTENRHAVVNASFLSKYYGGDPEGKNISVESPAGTIRCKDCQALVSASFLTQRNEGNPTSKIISIDGPARTLTSTGGNQDVVQAKFLMASNGGIPSSKVSSTEGPANVITTQDNKALVQACFMVQYNGGKPESRVMDVESPARTLTTTHGANQVLVQPSFLHSYYGSGNQNRGVEEPATTVTTKARHALIQAQYLINYNHSSNANTIDSPAPTITAADKLGMVQPEYFIDKQYGSGGANAASVDAAAGTILANDKHCLVYAVPFISRQFSSGTQNSSVDAPAGALMTVPKLEVVCPQAFIMPTNYDNRPGSPNEPLGTITANRKWHYLVNPTWFGNPHTTEDPCPVIVARQDKAPLYLVCTVTGDIAIRLDESDSPTMRLIKEFMVLYRIVDIKMRMLKVLELLLIQGFPADYILEGNQSDQKKFIGNSVHPLVPEAWVVSMYHALAAMAVAA